MFTKWDERFDELCGAVIMSSAAMPMADSSVRDWLYGLMPDMENERVSEPYYEPAATGRSSRGCATDPIAG